MSRAGVGMYSQLGVFTVRPVRGVKGVSVGQSHNLFSVFKCLLWARCG